MYNFVMSILMLVFCFSAITFVHKRFGKVGMFALIPLMSLVANIQVIKMVDVFGMAATLGNVVYSASFLITDILSEFYGKKEAEKAVKLGIISFFISTILIQIALYYPASSLDWSQEHLQAIFGFLPRIFLGSITAYAVSQWLDVQLFHYFKKKFKGLWIRNNCATMVAQFVDTCLVQVLMFSFVLSWKEIGELIVTAYIVKWFVAALDTPFLYINRYLFKKGKISND